MLLVGSLTSSLFWLGSAIKSEELACFVRPGRWGARKKPSALRLSRDFPWRQLNSVCFSIADQCESFSVA